MNRKTKCFLPITILGIVSLICTVLGNTPCFFYYAFNYVPYGNSYYELAFKFPSIINILSSLLALAPCVLFLLYTMMFHGRRKGTVLYPIVCGIIAVSPLLSIILNIILNISVFRNYWYLYAFAWWNILICLATLVPFALLTINATKGLNKKVYTIVATSIGLAIQLFIMISCFNLVEDYIKNEWYLYIFTDLMSRIGRAALYIALLLFGLNNRIPALVSLSPEKERQMTEKMPPEQASQDKLDLGMITEEEYQAQQENTISKL